MIPRNLAILLTLSLTAAAAEAAQVNWAHYPPDCTGGAAEIGRASCRERVCNDV